MRKIDRACQQRREHKVLSEDASFSDSSWGRRAASNSDILRTCYQQDKDKIIHCKAFRRLSHKTQVFLAVEGDHFRTRLTHTLEVAQIARTIARALGLNEDLTEAIALGHDLGHTPFGHTGEEALCVCLARTRGMTDAEGIACKLYKHNVQSLRVVEFIERNGEGLNLSHEVKNGFVCHTGGQQACTLEGRIVATADRIAYVNHDIDDAIRAGMLTEASLPASTHEVLGKTHSERIETLVLDMVETSAECGDIALSEPVLTAMLELRGFLFEHVYHSVPVMSEVVKAQALVEQLFFYFLDHPVDIPAEYRRISHGDDILAVTDFISGMTDRYAKSVFLDLFVPKGHAADLPQLSL